MKPWVRTLLAAVGGFAIARWLYDLATPEVPRRLPTDLGAPPPPLDTRESTIALASHLGFPVVEGNKIELLINGDEIFPAMLEAIEEARESINFLTFIYWHGEIAQVFGDALAAAGRRGVEVRVLLDAFGARLISRKLLARMRRAGCQIAWFNPLRWGHLGRAHHRTHRKLLITDGCVGFTGGVGIADEWTGDAQDPDHWRDDHFRIRGPVVHYLQGAFAENWRQATGEVLIGSRMFPALEPVGSAAAIPVFGRPSGRVSEIGYTNWYFAECAQCSLRLTTPYFVPTGDLEQALLRAARRGIDITLLLPSAETDYQFVRSASRALYPEFLEAGVKIYEFQPTMLHVKALTIDDEWAVIGSSNFDAFSFEHNFEMTLAVRDPDLVAELDRSFADDLARSRPVELGEMKRLPLWKKVRNEFAVLFRPHL